MSRGAQSVQWDPWEEAARRSNLWLTYGALPFDQWLRKDCMAVTVREEGITVITVRNGLDRATERFALTEELIHDERAVGDHVLPSQHYGDPLNRAEESVCRRLALRRIIPDRAVRRMLLQIDEFGDFDLWEWAEDLDVPAKLVFERLVRALLEAIMPRSVRTAAPSKPVPGTMRAYRLTAPIAVCGNLARAM